MLLTEYALPALFWLYEKTWRAIEWQEKWIEVFMGDQSPDDDESDYWRYSLGTL